MIMLSVYVGKAGAVCPHCLDCIPGCTGGDACPLVGELTENVRIFREGALGEVPKIDYSMPANMRSVFSSSLCEALVGIALAPAGGVSADLANAELYPTPTSIVRAARFGHCSVEEAILELSARTETADEAELSRNKAAVEMVKIVGGNVLTGIQGVYTFIWAKTAQLITRAAESVRLTTTTTTSRLTQADLTVKLTRPASESEFFERLHYYTWLLISLGIVHHAIFMKFVQEAIYEPRRRLGLSWQVCHELFII